MSISFHCESCKKRIKAPDSTGGKQGNCPYCEHRCYIPLPQSDDEPKLVLAPIDESAESQIEELMQETHHLTQEILSQSALPDNDPDSKAGNHTAQEKEVIKQSILYLRQMADSELKAAEATFLKLKKTKKMSIRILSSMARAEKPEPELADLPERTLQGLIRDVCTKLS